MNGGMSGFHEYLARRNKPAPSAALDKPIRVTFFSDFSASSKREELISLRSLVERLTTTQASEKNMLPWLKLAAFGDVKTKLGSLRHDANLLEISGVEADYDGEQLTLDRAATILRSADLAAILYTSPSHTEDAPRWRVLCPLSAPVAPDDRAALLARVNGLFVGALSRESFTRSQAYYYGRVFGNNAHTVTSIEGRFLDHATDLDKEAVGRPSRAVASTTPPPTHSPPAPRHDGGTAYGRAALDMECDNIRRAGDGSKHDTLNKAAFSIGGLVAAGELLEGEAFAALGDALNAIRSACKDFRHAQNTLATAFRDGMGKPRDVPAPPPPEPLAPAVATIVAQMLRRQAAKNAPSKPLDIPPVLMDVPGALRLFVDHCEATAISPQPFLSLAAGICLIGTLAGRRYRTTTDLRTNIYAVGVADSGAGKDHARKQIRKCLYAANLVQYLGGSDIASGAGMRTAMARHPSMLFQIDEFGDWLHDVLGVKAAAHRKQIAANLKELYSSANSIWTGAEYADQSKLGRPREDVHQPNACLYGTTTPGQFWHAIAGASLNDGLMARILLFVSPCSYPDEREPDLAEPSEALIAALQAVASGPEGVDGNLGSLMLAATAPTPLTVPETPDAILARRALRQEQLDMQRKSEGTYVTAIAGRLAENAMKLALIRAVAHDPQTPTITAADIAWGRTLAMHCVNTLLRDASRHVAENEYEQKLNKAMDIIRKHGPMTERDMIRRGFRLPERERREILSTLEAGRMVVAVQVSHSGAGRPTIRYAATKDVPAGTHDAEIGDD